MLRRSLLLSAALLLVSALCFSTVLDESDPPQVATNAELTAAVTLIFQESEATYQVYKEILTLLQQVYPKLQTISNQLQVEQTRVDGMQISLENAERSRAASEEATRKQIRDIKLQAYLIGSVALLASILIVIIF